MEIVIKKLSPQLADDYIEFFEKYAFCDGSEFTGCYCTWYNWNNDYEKELKLSSDDKRKNFKKDIAYHWILEGKLNGFLAYENDVPIGWCNADQKQRYDRLRMEHNPDTWKDSRFEDKILSIVCFIVSPNMRGKGIATALLKEVCEYAKTSGCHYLEAYPSKEGFSVTNYHGQFSMYEKLGFQLIGPSEIGEVARKYFCSN